MARILVTGAGSGLGLLTAQSLDAQGHEVVLHARTPERVDDQQLLERVQGSVFGDLAGLDTVHQIAEEANALAPFDAVIHNAGVIDGANLVPVNVLAPYALTALLERPARVIVLSSSMHRSGSPHHVADVIAGRRSLSYSDSKLLATAFALGLARRWPTTLIHAVDPGWVPTRMGGQSACDDLTEGHRTQEWLASVEESDIDPRTGGYWHHRSTRRPHPAALDSEFQDALFTTLASQTAIALPEE